MPYSYNVTLKPDAPAVQLDVAKEEAIQKGGTILHEYSLIKGFVVEFPDNHVDTFESNEHVHVEKDSQVKTQEE